MPCTVPRVWYNRYCYTLFLERCYGSLFLFSLNPSVLRWFTHRRPFPSPTWAWVYLSQKPHKRLGWADHKYREHLNFLQPSFHTPATLSTLAPFHLQVHPRFYKNYTMLCNHYTLVKKMTCLRLHTSTSAPRNTVTYGVFFSLLIKETMSELHLPMKFLTKILFNYFTD